MADKTCRTCGKTFESESESGLCQLFNSKEYENELKMVLEEFEIWNLNIAENDNLPQKICLTCFDSFCQIHNFRVMCIEAQMNFGEMCTGLDIFIKHELTDDDDDFPENCDGEELIIVKERYTFPGDELLKTTSTEEESNVVVPSDDVIDEDKSQLLHSSNDNANDNVNDNANDNTNVNTNENANDNNNEKEIEIDESMIDLKKYRCEFCMGFVSFDDPDELNTHYNELHSTESPYPCPKCDLKFDKKAKRNSHVRCHFEVTPLECKHCGKKFRGDKLMMAQHVAYYHVDKNRQCPICHLKFESISLKRYYYHMMWHNETKLLRCKFCDKKFIQSPHLQCHLKTHADDAQFNCKKCGLGFKNSILLKKHVLLHEKKELVPCPKCPKRFFTRVGIKLHNKKVHDPNKKPAYCGICDHTFNYQHDLVHHNHKKHDGPAPKVVKRTARPGTASSAKRKIIKKHKTKEVIKPHKCDKCDDAFVLEIQLLKHMKVHEEYRPHRCEFCAKCFKREAHLKLHVDNIHFHKKPHKCTICGAAFAQRSHLGDHHAVKHQNIRKHECKTCHKKFGTWQILKIHMLMHSSDRPHVCKICHKGFKQLMVLKSHMSNVHLSKNRMRKRRVPVTEVVEAKEEEEDLSELLNES
ncbi:zinc finger protein 540-like [Eupeodes corollae]|uniref:zinc finger protein 540-like n=1 Tax=Eupeodes corollae TaxID=290404 RepID=UPI00248F9B89|nr:zinc finger protein 540-like [Eupeodes corollae]